MRRGKTQKRDGLVFCLLEDGDSYMRPSGGSHREPPPAPAKCCQGRQLRGFAWQVSERLVRVTYKQSGSCRGSCWLAPVRCGLVWSGPGLCCLSCLAPSQHNITYSKRTWREQGRAEQGRPDLARPHHGSRAKPIHTVLCDATPSRASF